MKIQGSHPLYRLTSINGAKTDQRTEEKSSVQRESVQLSGEARWMQELKTAIEDIPEVRVDEVERALVALLLLVDHVPPPPLVVRRLGHLELEHRLARQRLPRPQLVPAVERLLVLGRARRAIVPRRHDGANVTRGVLQGSPLCCCRQDP